ncbi:MAG TPA: thioredoxin family protein [Candidatus Binataceae bacterium]|nr:thioredoxin family protein [Candidatus Binataceae bacterium]
MSHKVVSREEWIEARKQLLIKEKEFSRLGDQLSQQRRELPWVRVEKEYLFESPSGKESLSDLFAGKSQLAVYHFMFGPEWEAGCPHCSFWADNFDGIDAHLRAGDVTLIAISHAPLPKLEAFKQRIGWKFKWVSAGENGFNYDYFVSFTAEQAAKGEIYQNYRLKQSPLTEIVGISAFYKASDGGIFHTYSAYERGVETINGAYHWLDLMPKGRDEAGLTFAQSWVRHHDRYGSDYRGPGGLVIPA